jgi:PAS domain S-box-containing protein
MMTFQKPTNDERPAKHMKGSPKQRTGISKRREKLFPEEEKYRHILANMEEGYYEIDLKGRLTFVNPSMASSMGYDAQEVLGRDYRQFVSEESATRIEKAFQKIYGTGSAVKIIQYELIQKDGTQRRHEMSASLLRNASGASVGFFGISRDRTDALRLESALREREASYYGVMELCPDVISINEEIGRAHV